MLQKLNTEFPFPPSGIQRGLWPTVAAYLESVSKFKIKNYTKHSDYSALRKEINTNEHRLRSYNSILGLPASCLSSLKNPVPAKCCSPEQNASTVPPNTVRVYGNKCLL